MNCIRGVHGRKVDALVGTAAVLHHLASELSLIKKDSKVIVIHSTNEDTPDESNVMKIMDVSPASKI